MSNRLSIEVRKVIQRHDPNNPFNEIIIADDFGSYDIFLDQDEAPINPEDLLKRVFDEVKNGSSEYVETLTIHIEDRSGVLIEGDWIEWDDPRIAGAMKYWKEVNGIDSPETPVFNIGDDVLVPKPLAEDLWDHPFTGHIKDFKKDTDGTDLATVEDQDGDCWDVELSRLIKDVE